MSLFGLLWQSLKVKWVASVLVLGLAVVAGAFGDGPLPLVVGAFVLVVATLVYGVIRVTFHP